MMICFKQSKKFNFFMILCLICVTLLSVGLCLLCTQAGWGWEGDFYRVFSKVGLSVVRRALSVLFLKIGVSGGLAFAIVFAVWNALLTSNSPALLLHFMNDEDGTAASSSSWTRVLLGSSSSASSAEESTGAWPAPPANPGEGGAAEPPNENFQVSPYPYRPDEEIGGDCVLSIKRRLLASNPFPSFEEDYLAHIEAEDLFESKVDIYRLMSVLDPAGNWIGQGSQALENSRSASGEHSLETLSRMYEELQRDRAAGPTFRSLQSKMFSRRQLNDENSST